MGTSMGTETTGDNRFTTIAEFDAEPEQRAPLLKTLTDEIERWVCDRPGFVTARVLEDNENASVVVYTEWNGRDDWESFRRDPEHAVLCDKLRQLGIGETFDGRPHDVHRVIETVPAKPWP